MYTNIQKLGNSLAVPFPEIKREHIPLSERLKGWKGQPYHLNNEDRIWLNIEPLGDEEYDERKA